MGRAEVSFLVLALAIAVVIVLGGRETMTQPQRGDQQTQAQQQADLIVGETPPEEPAEERIADYTANLATWTAVLGGSTILLWVTSAIVAFVQRRDTNASLAQAARSAGAIETVGTEFAASVRNQLVGMANYENASQLQLRAYLVVYIGTAFAQNRERNIRFQIKPNIINAGFTPARKVRWAIRCGVAPNPLPREFALEPPGVDPGLGTMNMGPHQTLSMTGILPEFIEGEDAVAALKAGDTERLYVWGTVYYEDVFERQQHTDFCQSVAWAVNEEGTEFIDGEYPGRHNEAT